MSFNRKDTICLLLSIVILTTLYFSQSNKISEYEIKVQDLQEKLADSKNELLFEKGLRERMKIKSVEDKLLRSRSPSRRKELTEKEEKDSGIPVQVPAGPADASKETITTPKTTKSSIIDLRKPDLQGKKTVNLIYWNAGSPGNFGDDLSRYIVETLINKKKYNLVFNQHKIKDPQGTTFGDKYINIIGVGSYIHRAYNNTLIYGSGMLEDLPANKPELNMDIYAVRGPKTRDNLRRRGYDVPDPCPMGDPALLVKKLYQPKFIASLKDKICLVPHMVHHEEYTTKMRNLNYKINNYSFHIVKAVDHYNYIIDQIYSCKGTISSSLHGLIIADAFDKPNLWLDEIKIRASQNEFKFYDYFLSQGREPDHLSKLEDFNEDMFYKGGNKIDLDVLYGAFPLF